MEPEKIQQRIEKNADELRKLLFGSTVTVAVTVAFVSNDVRTAIIDGVIWNLVFWAFLRLFVRRRVRQGDVGSILVLELFTFAKTAAYLFLGSAFLLLAEFGFENAAKMMLKKYPYPEADGIISSIIRFLVVSPSSESWFLQTLLITTTALYLANLVIKKPKKGNS